ncbi:MAG: Tex family protein [Pseudomonadota bacterium]
MKSIQARIAGDIGAREAQVNAAVDLLDGGATVPFIARYRKEITGGLDDTQLRRLEERLGYLRELEDRRTQVLTTIEEQGQLDDTLRAAIEGAETKTRLEDLYLPYKPRRRTRAQIAREAGLEPLAKALLENPTLDPGSEAQKFANAEADLDGTAALEGARNILMEDFSENADLVGRLRDRLWRNGQIQARLAEGKEQQGAKYRDYFEHAEAIGKIPSHRLLALFRARNEGILYLDLVLPDVPDGDDHPCVRAICAAHEIADRGRAADPWLLETARRAWKSKIHMHLSLDLFGRARETAEAEAIGVFGDNLRDLLLAAPAGRRATMGLDPGLRTGVKVAVVDATGKLVETATIYPHAPKKDVSGALGVLRKLVTSHGVELVAIGNGTGSRETERLVAELSSGEGMRGLVRLVVSEAGASVYSASETAAKEFPDLDVSLRGAVSIARRLQDPLAELVKIDPKAIGVGQYQHDVNQVRLARALDACVEDCVNAVGVELNTASAALLARVAGLSEGVAENIVKHRDAEGPFARRGDLLKVSRLGAKTFEQAAGFLRIKGGSDPLDASGVHPEAYGVVERVLEKLGVPIDGLLGNAEALRGVRPAEVTCGQFGEPTVRDILSELEKPGRDPRPEFKTARFNDEINTIQDLKAGQVLEGVVSNVTNFGAFVDLGVHQDGLVHISQLANRFVEDPRTVVKAGDIVKVKVLEVDVPRKRIALTMKLEAPAARPDGKGAKRGKPTDDRSRKPRRAKPGGKAKSSKPEPRGAFGDALAAALAKKK